MELFIHLLFCFEFWNPFTYFLTSMGIENHVNKVASYLSSTSSPYHSCLPSTSPPCSLFSQPRFSHWTTSTSSPSFTRSSAPLNKQLERGRDGSEAGLWNESRTWLVRGDSGWGIPISCTRLPLSTATWLIKQPLSEGACRLSGSPSFPSRSPSSDGDGGETSSADLGSSGASASRSSSPISISPFHPRRHQHASHNLHCQPAALVIPQLF